MKILITGGAGFIGSHIIAYLIKDHELVIGARNVEAAARMWPGLQIISCDFTKDLDIAIWKERLQGFDAVVNCVGILHSFKDNTIETVHYQSPKAMFEACEQLGIKKVIQLSAIGTEQTRHIAYSDSKKALDDYLLASTLDANVLRPSFVYSETSYGGSSLFRALAAMPLFVPLVGKGEQQFQPIHANDLAQMVKSLLESAQTGSRILYMVGPQTMSLKSLLGSLRTWLGLSSVPFVKCPLWVLKLIAPIGGVLPWWPVNKTTVGMMQFPAIAITNKEELAKTEVITKVKPRSWQMALAERPSGVQDRWHARLYFLSPLIRIILAILWILSGLISMLNSSESYALMAQFKMLAAMQSLAIYGLSVMDIMIGLWVLSGRRDNVVSAIQFIVVLGYTLALTVLMPSLWAEPFGPILKNLPILVLVLVFNVIGKER